MQINTVQDFVKTLENGPYTFPGGYPLYFICQDGAILSFQAVKDNEYLINCAINEDNDPQWRVIGADINYEDDDLYCDHSGIAIECAYCD